jgi:excisionase family DNA binding protein
MAVGLAMAQQLMQQPGGVLGQTAPPAGAQPPPLSSQAQMTQGFDLLSPADAAKILGVSEGVVLSSIAAGELIAKKIGSTYRINRAALEEFLK